MIFRFRQKLSLQPSRSLISVAISIDRVVVIDDLPFVLLWDKRLLGPTKVFRVRNRYDSSGIQGMGTASKRGVYEEGHSARPSDERRGKRDAKNEYRKDHDHHKGSYVWVLALILLR